MQKSIDQRIVDYTNQIYNISFHDLLVENLKNKTGENIAEWGVTLTLKWTDTEGYKFVSSRGDDLEKTKEQALESLEKEFPEAKS